MRPAAWRVCLPSRRRHYDVILYFDRETDLLAMSETRYKDARSGKEVTQDTVFTGYQDVSGLQTPARVSIRRDGRLAVEANVDTRFVEKLNARVFAKP